MTDTNEYFEPSLLERASERIRFAYRHKDGYEVVAQPYLIALLLQIGVALASGVIFCVNGVLPGYPSPTFGVALTWFCSFAGAGGLLLTIVFVAFVGWRIRATTREISEAADVPESEWLVLLGRLWYWRKFARVATGLSVAGFVGSLGLTYANIAATGLGDAQISRPLQVVNYGGYAVVYTLVWIFAILASQRLRRECDDVFTPSDEDVTFVDETVE